MVIAALVCFTDPAHRLALRTRSPRSAAPVVAVPEVEPTPLLEAAERLSCRS